MARNLRTLYALEVPSSLGWVAIEGHSSYKIAHEEKRRMIQWNIDKGYSGKVRVKKYVPAPEKARRK